MKNNKTVDTILAVILILGAAFAAVYAFCMGTTAGFTAGCFAASTALAFWLAKRLKNQKQELAEKNNNLNGLYKAAMEQVVSKRQENEDLKAKLSELAEDAKYWKGVALKPEEKHDEPTAVVEEVAPQEPVAAEAPKAAQKKRAKSISEVKATVAKVKKHPNKNKQA